MATYFVNSGASGANNGSSWTDAYTAFNSAVTSAGTNDIIKVHVGHAEASAANTITINCAGVYCVDKDNSDALAIQNGSTQYIANSNFSGWALAPGSGVVTELYGLAFVYTGTGSVTVNNLSHSMCSFKNCLFWLNTSTSTVILGIGSSTASAEYVGLFQDCVFKYGHSSQVTRFRGWWSFVGCSVDSGGSIPSPWIVHAATSMSSKSSFYGCDLSALSGTVIGDMVSGAYEAVFVQCKFDSGATILASASQAAPSTNVTVLDCSSGDEHYHFAYYNNVGSLTADTGIYANDGAEYNTAGSKLSWKIVTNSNASLNNPFVSPWFSAHNEGTSAITPSIEIVRSGSATAYQNDEVWSRWLYKATSGSTLANIDESDRVAVLGSAANQDTGALDASGWTGENATSWFGKLGPTASITPAEIGDIAVSVCVGEPSITVYVDPQIRGLS